MRGALTGGRRLRRQGRRQEDRDRQGLVRRLARQRGARRAQARGAGRRRRSWSGRCPATKASRSRTTPRRKPDVTFVNGTSAAQDTTLRDPAPNFFRFSTDGAQWMAGLGDLRLQRQELQESRDLRRGLFLPLHAGVRLHGAVLQGRRPRRRRSSGCRSAPRISPRSSPRCRTTSTRSTSCSAAPTRSTSSPNTSRPAARRR